MLWGTSPGISLESSSKHVINPHLNGSLSALLAFDKTSDRLVVISVVRWRARYDVLMWLGSGSSGQTSAPALERRFSGYTFRLPPVIVTLTNRRV